MYWHSGMGMWGLGFMVFDTLLLVVLFAGAVSLLYGPNSGTSRSAEDNHASSERLLAEQYARGEIDDEEYGHRLNVLRGA